MVSVSKFIPPGPPSGTQGVFGNDQGEREGVSPEYFTKRTVRWGVAIIRFFYAGVFIGAEAKTLIQPWPQIGTKPHSLSYPNPRGSHCLA